MNRRDARDRRTLDLLPADHPAARDLGDWLRAQRGRIDGVKVTKARRSLVRSFWPMLGARGKR